MSFVKAHVKLMLGGWVMQASKYVDLISNFGAPVFVDGFCVVLRLCHVVGKLVHCLQIVLCCGWLVARAVSLGL